jgi:DNA-binding transcriptional regulator YdaS (Cro superfamily)
MSKTIDPIKDAAQAVIDHFQTQAEIARRLGYPDRRNVAPWANGDKPYPPNHCVTLERESGGVITRQMLRPHDYANWWPELVAA